MTPAVNLLKKSKTQYQLHEYEHVPSADSYGLEAAQKLGIEPGRVFKTLVASLDGGGSEKKFVVALVPVNTSLNMKSLAKAAAAKKAAMADKADVARVTGYILGGVSPLGQKKRLPTFIDESAVSYTSIYISAGRRGLEIELRPGDLKQLTNGRFVGISSDECQ